MLLALHHAYCWRSDGPWHIGTIDMPSSQTIRGCDAILKTPLFKHSEDYNSSRTRRERREIFKKPTSSHIL